MSDNKFGIKEVLSFSWKKAVENIKFFLMIYLFMVAVVLPISLFQNALENQGSGAALILSLLLSLAYSVFNVLVNISLIKISLEICRGAKVSFNSFWQTMKSMAKDWKLALNYILGSCLYGLIVFGGFLLLIIPGFIWLIKYCQWMYLIIDKGLKPSQAIKQSGQITQGSKARIFWLVLSYIGVIILGVLPGILTLGFGLYLIAGMMMICNAYVYLKLIALEPIASAPPEPAPFNPQT